MRHGGAEMAKEPVLSLRGLVKYIDDMSDRVLVSDQGTPFQRRRLMAFLQGVQQTVRAFCLSDVAECDYICQLDLDSRRSRGSRKTGRPAAKRNK
jgi:hypothetical protein